MTTDPEPLGGELKPDHATYAPLSFEVGTHKLEQWNALLWTGNVLFSKRMGTAHFPKRVISARPLKSSTLRQGAGNDGVRRGVRLRVMTTDRRRDLLVRIAPDGGRAIRVAARLSNGDGVISIGDSFDAGEHEGFYGFGGRHGSVNKHGEKLFNYTEQSNFGGPETLQATYLLAPLVELGSDYTLDDFGNPPTDEAHLPGGYERFMVANGMNATYYPQAQFLSSRGYGFLLNRDEFARWRMANDRDDAWQVQAASRKLDYSVALGPSPKRSMRTLTGITGRHMLPPKWAQGPTLWRAIQVPAAPGAPAIETATSYKAKVEQDLADIEAYDLDVSAYAFEGWAVFDDLDYVRGVIDRLHAMGIKAILYHRAYVANDSLSTQPDDDYEETMATGLVATTADGQPYVFGANGGGDSTLLDFTNPDTRDWWRRRLKLTLGLGMDGFMQDFGEQVQVDMHFANGESGRTMHNRYPVIWHRLSRRILDRWQQSHPDRGKIWFFTRSGYSGRPGSAAYEMGTFPGDETTEWSAGSGLRSLAPDMLNRGVGGAFGFNTDIGGYADFIAPPPDAELFTRWSEWAALTPYFRVHNSASTGTRMPWSYGEPTLSRWKRLADLHQAALPYIRELWRDGRRDGTPIARPMWLAEPSAPGARSDSEQWMLGPDVLVAPVLYQGATERTVNFPRGCWERQAPGGETYRGPVSATVPAPLGQLPFFFRCGTRPFASRHGTA